MRTAVSTMILLGCLGPGTAGAADPAGPSATQPQRQFAAAFSSLTAMKAKVATAFAESGRFPGSYQEARLDGPQRENNFTIQLGREGLLTITFNEHAAPELAGNEFVSAPTVNEHGDVTWTCSAPRIPAAVHMRGCR